MIIKPDFKKRKKVEQLAAIIALQADKGEEGENNDSGSRGDLCLEVEQMASLLENRCSSEELKIFHAHLGHCEACYQEWLSLKLSSEDKADKGSRVRKYRYIGSALAVAASVVVYLNISNPPYLSYQKSEVSQRAPVVSVEGAADAVDDEFLVDDKVLGQAEEVAEKTVALLTEQKRKSSKLQSPPQAQPQTQKSVELEAGRSPDEDLSVGAAPGMESLAESSPVVSAPPAPPAAKATKSFVKEKEQKREGFGAGVEDKPAPRLPRLETDSELKAQQNSYNRERSQPQPAEEQVAQDAKDISVVTEAAGNLTAVKKGKEQSIDSWLQAVREGCLSSQKEMVFWSALLQEGENIIQAKSTPRQSEDEEKVEKAVNVVELLEGMDEKNVLEQCRLLLELLADGEKNR